MKKAQKKVPQHLTYFITVLVVGALNQWTKPRNVIEKQQSINWCYIPMGTA
jgi:hypothetical protein